MEFSKALISWYLQNKRNLPWRKTKNPYHIWLSEIILQQTRVAQGLPYYLKFTEAFPTVESLANADEEEVLKLWQGLGYYSRARNLHETAKNITQNFNGTFPKNYLELKKLKGVGDYTAAAIASFSYDENIAVVDGNVYRALARYFGLDLDISQPKTKKTFQELADNLLPKGHASVFNQAIMEFGALQCVPKNPACDTCIFNNSCFALQNKKVNELPVKLKKTKVTNRYLNFIVVKDANGNFILEKRSENDIWKNLHQFPLFETQKKDSLENIIKSIKATYNVENIKLFNEKEIIHKLSHQKLHIRFFEVTLKTNLKNSITLNELVLKPFPIIIHNFIEANYLN
ncbi:MAG: A/G-specific adenine glycosylase [Flavobacteriaceae bacterium]|nr:A/G-specific adenine glycosylase [Flavobacteriaceae bacterium]